ncbi:MAG: hypothetical protein V1723_02255 [Candidatus Uhrbacteria bacterium]
MGADTGRVDPFVLRSGMAIYEAFPGAYVAELIRRLKRDYLERIPEQYAAFGSELTLGPELFGATNPREEEVQSEVQVAHELFQSWWYGMILAGRWCTPEGEPTLLSERLIVRGPPPKIERSAYFFGDLCRISPVVANVLSRELPKDRRLLYWEHILYMLHVVPTATPPTPREPSPEIEGLIDLFAANLRPAIDASPEGLLIARRAVVRRVDMVDGRYVVLPYQAV